VRVGPGRATRAARLPEPAEPTFSGTKSRRCPFRAVAAPFRSGAIQARAKGCAAA